MAIRPTEHWRQYIMEEARQVATGELDAQCAGAAAEIPESMLILTDEVLQRFEAELAGLNNPSDEAIFGVIKRVVLALNNAQKNPDVTYDTDEREQLCLYIDESLTETGINVEALAVRHGLQRHEITDEWRDW
ncbi:hypothetical protein ACWDRB_63375 [Nonomuraea sp. NPDC003707]